MRRTALLALAALAALAILFIAPTAQAATSANYATYGGCGFSASSQEHLTGGRYVGAVFNVSVTMTRAPIPTPVPATVSCKIQINGVDVPGAQSSYTDLSPLAPGVQAGATPLDYVVDDNDIVSMCQKTVYTGTGEIDDWDCYGRDWPIPPALVYELVNNGVNYVFTDIVDPKACPVLMTHAGTYGPMTITPNGDVLGPDPLESGSNLYFDCPPYGS